MINPTVTDSGRQWCRFCDVWHDPFNGHVCSKEDLIRHIVHLSNRVSAAEGDVAHLRELLDKTQPGKKYILSERATIDSTFGFRHPVNTTYRKVVEVLFVCDPWAVVREGGTSPYICFAEDLCEMQ